MTQIQLRKAYSRWKKCKAKKNVNMVKKGGNFDVNV